MIDPFQTEPSPYTTLGVTAEATDADLLAAFKAALAGGRDARQCMLALKRLQDPVQRTLVDVFEYHATDLEGLTPSPLEDPSALEPARRAATARAWEEQLVRQFPDLRIAHSLAVLWYWWTEHEANGETDGRTDQDPSLPEIWERSIAYWAMLVNADAFWQRRCRGGGDVARRAGQRLVEDLRNRLDRTSRDCKTRHDDAVADALQRLEVVLDAEVDMGGRIAEGGISTRHGKVTCGPLLLRHLRLMDAIAQQVDRALEANPRNADLRTLHDALSPLSHVEMLIQKQQPQQALDALAALPAEERDTPEARGMRASALRLLGDQAASVGDFERALLVWQEALDNAQTAEDISAIRSQVASTCLKRAASMPDAQRDAAIDLLSMAHDFVDDEKLRARLAELLVRRGIDTINRAQKKAAEWTIRSVKIALRKGITDLDQAAKLGSERAKEQAEIGHALLQQAESGLLGIPPQIAEPLAEANAAAGRGDWDTAVKALTRAIDRAGPEPPGGLTSNLTVCLANRANEKTNLAIGMINQAIEEVGKKARTIDDGLRELSRRGRVAGLLLWLAGSFFGYFGWVWVLVSVAIGKGLFPGPFRGLSGDQLVVASLVGWVLIWILIWAWGQLRSVMRTSAIETECALCRSTARYEVRASKGTVSLCTEHAHKLEAWMNPRPYVPASVTLLVSAHEDMMRAARVGPSSAEYSRRASEIEKILQQARAGNPGAR